MSTLSDCQWNCVLTSVLVKQKRRLIGIAIHKPESGQNVCAQEVSRGGKGQRERGTDNGMNVSWFEKTLTPAHWMLQ